MPSIFDDERRQNGSFSRGPIRVGPKSPLNASKMLESEGHFLALFSCSETILDTNADNRKILTTTSSFGGMLFEIQGTANARY